MTLTTDRLALPLLAAAQAQKEVTHNEALALLDSLVQPVVVAVAPAKVPEAPTPGQGWIVGPTPAGAWTGRAGALAIWTTGGWRFVSPFDGMSVWSLASATWWRFDLGAWANGVVTGTALVLDGLQLVGLRGAPIASPLGGSVVDVQARKVISVMISAMEAHGLIAK